MEMLMTINEMLPEEITKFTSSLICPGLKNKTDLTSSQRRMAQDLLQKRIDQLGQQSAQSQGLFKVITSVEKLRQSNHELYVLKDPRARGGTGDLIGFLKVGHKKLFLYDENSKVCEVEPLCVLDFFLVESHQRHGFGRLLFDYMLRDQNTKVEDLAIDGPSDKMAQFLHKIYGIVRLLRQSNNFAVAPEFFANAETHRSGSNRKLTGSSTPGRSTPMEAPSAGRYAAQKPSSCVGQIIHGDDTTTSNNNGAADVCHQEDFEEEEVEHVPDVPEEEVKQVPDVPVAVPEEEPKVELEQSSTRPSSLGVEPIAPLPLFVSPVPPHVTPEPPLLADTPAGVATPRDSTQLTKRGHYDVKFHHNKLW